MRLSEFALQFMHSIRRTTAGVFTVARPVHFLKAVVAFKSAGIDDTGTATVFTKLPKLPVLDATARAAVVDENAICIAAESGAIVHKHEGVWVDALGDTI